MPAKHLFVLINIRNKGEVRHAVLSAPCSLVVTCWERADLLALLCVMFSCFLTFPYGVLGHVWYLTLSIPDHCLLPYYDQMLCSSWELTSMSCLAWGLPSVLFLTQGLALMSCLAWGLLSVLFLTQG